MERADVEKLITEELGKAVTPLSTSIGTLTGRLGGDDNITNLKDLMGDTITTEFKQENVFAQLPTVQPDKYRPDGLDAKTFFMHESGLHDILVKEVRLIEAMANPQLYLGKRAIALQHKIKQIAEEADKDLKTYLALGFSKRNAEQITLMHGKLKAEMARQAIDLQFPIDVQKSAMKEAQAKAGAEQAEATRMLGEAESRNI